MTALKIKKNLLFYFMADTGFKRWWGHASFHCHCQRWCTVCNGNQLQGPFMKRFNCQALLLWACRQPRERLMHTAELSSLLNVHHYMIKHSKAWEKSGPLTGEWAENTKLDRRLFSFVANLDSDQKVNPCVFPWKPNLFAKLLYHPVATWGTFPSCLPPGIWQM